MTVFNKRWDCIRWDFRISDSRYPIVHWTPAEAAIETTRDGARFRFQTIWNRCLTLYRSRGAGEISSKYITRGQLSCRGCIWQLHPWNYTCLSPLPSLARVSRCRSTAYKRNDIAGGHGHMDARKRITRVIHDVVLNDGDDSPAACHRCMIRGVAHCPHWILGKFA